jgi:hypothetical protein
MLLLLRVEVMYVRGRDFEERRDIDRVRNKVIRTIIIIIIIIIK